MSMRITQNMLTQQFLYNITQINNHLQQAQEQMSTGKTLNQPSDNPLAVSQDMAVNAAISQNNSYQSTVSAGLTWMNNTSNTISQISSSLQNIQQNVIKALNSTNQSASAQQGLYETTKQYVQGIEQLVNSQQDNRYLFNGTNTNLAPLIQGSSIVFSGTSSASNASINLEISAGIPMNINVTAANLLLTDPTTGSVSTANATGSADLQNTLNSILSDLKTGNQTNLETQLGNLNNNMQNVTNINAELGSRIQRLTSLQNQLTQFSTNLTNQKGVIEDANMAKVITKFSTDQTIYQAALKMGSQILLPSLVSYLPNG